jgi:hypothetical protein
MLVWTHKAWFLHSTWCYSRIWRQSLCYYCFTCVIALILKALKYRHTTEGATPLRYLPPVDHLCEHSGLELLIRVVAPLLHRPVNRKCTRFSSEKYVYIWLSNNGQFLSLTNFRTPKKQTAVFYVTPHIVSSERIIFSPKLKHWFFPLFHYFCFLSKYKYIILTF